MNYNKVMVGGNLVRDPELRYTPKGTAVAKISIAVNRKWETGDGEKKEEVTFVEVTAWGRTAEVIGQYFTKGRPIFIEGRLQMEKWEDKTNHEKRQKMTVVCEGFQFAGGENTSAGSAPASRPTTAAIASEPAESEQPADDDVPF